MKDSMRITYLTAGAAGMFCGSCMNDNAVAKELIKAGHDCVLMPVYTPIRTDVEDMSVDRVFLGGVNVYLSQKIPLIRYLPRWAVGWLDHPWVIKSLTSKAGKTSPELLGQLAISMLDGLEGNQKQEFEDLLRFLQTSIRPETVLLTNLLIGGVIPQMASNADVWVMLQGDDIFLDSLSVSHRAQAVERMRRLVGSAKGFICHSQAYAQSMQSLLGIPESKMHVVPLGVATEDFTDRAATGSEHRKDDSLIRLGYLARMAPEKGLHLLVDAFIELRRNGKFSNVRLSMAGWMGPQHAGYWKEQQAKLHRAGLDGQWSYAGTVNRAEKVAFLESLDLFCVPTTYADPKGIFLLEAVASGLPYVMPEHGAFPELHRRIAAAAGEVAGGVAIGQLYPQGTSGGLVKALESVLERAVKRGAASPLVLAELDIAMHTKRLVAVLQGKSSFD
jgi:glycosyltransferase involved in cell wall biosynthesis